ncbi:Na+/H+ antiporter NhaA [Helicobacter himalayensis]|uniref:Na+/H+ antiporter NhaA n=1 Tax=Helicobacter himalayensis TaxID=1591088 RepID=UPI003D6E185A
MIQKIPTHPNRRYSYLKDKLQYDLQRFIAHESFGGILLGVCLVLAMVVANSPYSEWYLWLQKFEFGIFFGELELKVELLHFINDVLMSFFFLLVGLEMKREILYGELAGFKKVSFSVLAALGGIAVPIVMYLCFTHGTLYEKGFGIAMSTDTAFALGVILLLGDRVPKIVKIFLVTLAVADDLGAISVIALFYSDSIEPFWVCLSLVVIALLGYCNFRDTKHLSLYFLLGTILWICVYLSGIHVTIAAVLLALIIPGRTRVNRKYFANMFHEFERIKRITNNGADILHVQEQKQGFWKSTFKNIKNFMTSSSTHNVNMAKASELVYMLDTIGTYSRYAQNPLLRLEHALQPLCAYFIVPIFAFMNAGVALDMESMESILTNHVVLGTTFGLVLGKPIGIFLFAYLGEKLNLSVRPEGLNNFHVIAVGAISGVGFTMSIFVANLAYKDDLAAIDLSKISILIASAIAVVLGITLMALATRKKNVAPEDFLKVVS